MTVCIYIAVNHRPELRAEQIHFVMIRKAVTVKKCKAALAVVILLMSVTLGWAGSDPNAAKPNLSKDKTLYVVGYAHLDTEWRWDYTTTIDDFIKSTLDDNFTLFEKYPAYTFNFAG